MPGQQKQCSFSVLEAGEWVRRETHENKHIRLPATESAFSFITWIHTACNLKKKHLYAEVRFTLISQALWFGQRSGLAVICRAEPRQDCPVREDRSGPRNDKSTYESKTGRERDRSLCSVLFHWPSAAFCSLQAELHHSNHHEDRYSCRWKVKQCLSCSDCYTYNCSFPSLYLSIWGEKAFPFHRALVCTYFGVKLYIID